MAVATAAGLLLAGCSGTESENGEIVTAASVASTTTEAVLTPLVIELEEGSDSTADPTTSTTSPTSSDPPTSAETSTTAPATTAAPTTAAPTTAAPTTAAPTTPTTSPPTTAAPTTAAPTTAAPTTAPPTTVSMLETREEILNLALPKFGGGSFNPDSMAGKNVVLWFWGAH